MLRNNQYIGYLYQLLRTDLGAIIVVILILFAFFAYSIPLEKNEIIAGRVLGLRALESGKRGLLVADVEIQNKQKIVVLIKSNTNCLVGKSIWIRKTDALLGHKYDAMLQRCH